MGRWRCSTGSRRRTLVKSCGGREAAHSRAFRSEAAAHFEGEAAGRRARRWVLLRWWAAAWCAHRSEAAAQRARLRVGGRGGGWCAAAVVAFEAHTRPTHTSAARRE
eukprot:2333204-Prymnesium_polylepis.1